MCRKVIFLTTSLAFAGAQTQLVGLAVALKKRGWNVKIISMISSEAFFFELIEYDIPVYSLDMQRARIDLRALFRLVKILKKERPDILHSHMVHANFMARITRILVSVPVLISTAHSICEGGYGRDWWYRLTDFLCDMTTQVSEAGLQRYVERGMVSPAKAMFVPNGVNIVVFKRNLWMRQRERKALKVDHCFVWLAVGRFSKAKDYPNMIEAFAFLCKEMGNSVLLIAGDGVLLFEIEKLADKFGIGARVKFLGIRQDIPNLMNAADAYVMSSIWEGMPCVLLEASACELPIITTGVGGTGEIVRDGETGFLVLPGEPERLANAMITLERLPVERRLEMGRAGRKYIEETYALERIVDQWEELYSKLIHKR